MDGWFSRDNYFLQINKALVNSTLKVLIAESMGSREFYCDYTEHIPNYNKSSYSEELQGRQDRVSIYSVRIAGSRAGAFSKKREEHLELLSNRPTKEMQSHETNKQPVPLHRYVSVIRNGGCQLRIN